MAWRVVRSLTALRTQINAACPGRRTGADGTIGDSRHAESASDHNPAHYAALGSTPVVCALDITHDPAHGCDTFAIAEAVRASRDPRISYIISNHRIASNHSVGGHPAWAWRPYTGSGDPHVNHAHFSSVHTALADDERPWAIRGGTHTPESTPTSGDDDMLQADERQLLIQTAYRVEGILRGTGSNTPTGTPGKTAAEANGLANQVGQALQLLAIIAKAQGVDHTAIADIQQRAGVSDAQAAAMATAIADKLVASGANGLTAADHAGVVADVKQALAEGTA